MKLSYFILCPPLRGGVTMAAERRRGVALAEEAGSLGHGPGWDAGMDFGTVYNFIPDNPITHFLSTSSLLLRSVKSIAWLVKNMT